MAVFVITCRALCYHWVCHRLYDQPITHTVCRHKDVHVHGQTRSPDTSHRLPPNPAACRLICPRELLPGRLTALLLPQAVFTSPSSWHCWVLQQADLNLRHLPLPATKGHSLHTAMPNKAAAALPRAPAAAAATAAAPSCVYFPFFLALLGAEAPALPPFPPLPLPLAAALAAAALAFL